MFEVKLICTEIIRKRKLNLCFVCVCVCAQVPTVSMSVEGSPALNRLRWSQSGREIAVGDSEGQIHIYDVGEVRQ